MSFPSKGFMSVYRNPIDVSKYNLEPSILRCWKPSSGFFTTLCYSTVGGMHGKIVLKPSLLEYNFSGGRRGRIILYVSKVSRNNEY
jgi:hypothetical protein